MGVFAADIGLRADDGRTPQSILGQLNSLKLQQAMDKGTPITWPAGDIYLARTATTPATVSCGRWDFQTAGGYSIEPTPQYGKVGTRIICKAGPVLRICGVGFILNGPVEIIGDGKSDCIQVEGRTEPATGHHRFSGLLCRNWGCAIHALADQAESHADNSRCDACQFANVACVFRSDNQQAVNWRFNDLLVLNLNGPAEQIVCDVQRGGNILIDRLICCHPKVVVFQVKDFSPNTCRLVCRDLEFDHFEDGYLTAVKYAGPDNPEEWRHWFIDVDGFACMKLPKAKLIDAPDCLNKQDININIRTLYGEK